VKEDEMDATTAAKLQFQAAHADARRDALIDSLSGRPAAMPTLDDLRGSLPVSERRALGLRTIPLQQIVGSEGRASDFDRRFQPRAAHLAERWSRVAQAMSQGVALPPIVVYKLGERYFVSDGNHRVSVARHRGQDQISAYVTELLLDGPLPAALAVPAADAPRGLLGALAAAARRALRPSLAAA
jgi:hypothetical protein